MVIKHHRVYVKLILLKLILLSILTEVLVSTYKQKIKEYNLPGIFKNIFVI
jgi:hypothetical protein